jgi:fatty-acyl-CoA synthase
MKVFDWIASHATRDPDKLAQLDWHTQRRYTYRDMHERVARLAGYLQSEYGVTRGDRVALLSFNGSHVFDLQFACARLGAVFVPLNNRLAVPEIEYIVADLEPTVLVWGEGFEEIATGLARNCTAAGHFRHDTEEGIEQAQPVYQMVEQSAEDTWIILYTSGTTGTPKGVCLHHGMLIANILACAGPARISRDTVNLCFLPHFHTGGLNIFANPCFYFGGTNITLQSFDAPLLLKILGDSSLGVSHFIGVPSTFQMLAAEPGFASTDFSHIVSPFIGGAPAAPALLEEYAAVGLSLIHGFGMTEAGPIAITLDAESSRAKPGSCGMLPINMELKLIKKDGTEAKTGEIGEILLRGEAVTRGYWRNPAATGEVFSDDWLKTGDAAYCDAEGFFFIADRWKNMYISGGENVYPAEVEKAIYGLDAVFETAVVGVPHEKWGETGVAYVALQAGMQLSESDIIDHCRSRLAKYKVPDRVVFLDELPHNATGKILRHQLPPA